jgi:prevent-host-death family protein
MRSISAKDAKYHFGRLIDDARAEPVIVEKHGRPVVVVLAVEEFERLRSLSGESGDRPEAARGAPLRARRERPE